ncbi:MAG: hypothetical protein ACM3KS_00075 [Phycisphaerales bacterium]
MEERPDSGVADSVVELVYGLLRKEYRIDAKVLGNPGLTSPL